MDTSNIQDFLQLHDNFARRVRSIIAALGAETVGGHAAGPDGGDDELVQRFQQRLDAIAAAKQRVVERLDDEANRLQQTIERLSAARTPAPALRADDRPAPEDREASAALAAKMTKRKPGKR